ncbi:hypothetical protein [Methylosarcina fibrata]|uniref:hypothetical protein n=1 Tax=Methylosarcina fibrata TaxID=105972 RepID=UPI0003A62ECF|nr:hypothetical protein [Methylosarcina fibrata]
MILLKFIRAMALASLFMTAGSAWATIPDGACGTTVFDLNNEKNSADKLGTVTVANDATNLYVKFDLTVTGSNFNYVNLWVGTDLQNKLPVPYMFPNPVRLTGTTYTYVLPLSSLGIIDVTTSCPVIAIDAFAVVSDGGEVTTNGRAQGKYTLCCDQPPQIGECETAFAKGGYVFTTDSKSNPENLPSLKLTKNRWGWAINVKDNGTTVYNIWKGAGLNDTTKGELVGTLTVEKNGTLVKVTYNLTGDVMNELHIYVGDKMPNTIAPGQFGFTKDFDPAVSSFSKTFSVTDTNSDGIWIIAHAVSCTVLD